MGPALLHDRGGKHSLQISAAASGNLIGWSLHVWRGNSTHGAGRESAKLVQPE